MSWQSLGHRVISASAGSGKTHQLTSRYLGLVAAGTEVNTILATTFTRKAAGEILDRVLKRLAEAAGAATAAQKLTDEIQAPKEERPDFTALLRVLLGNLHRARIGTLDSFTMALAGSFALELGLPARWSICDEADDGALRDDALERALAQNAETISKLFSLLSKGETKRSVQGELRSVIKGHYEAYRGSERLAWEALTVPQSVPEADIQAALAQLRVFDFSACGNKNFFKARDGDIGDFENGSWMHFLGTGLAQRVLAGETNYSGKLIPLEAHSLYGPLIQHARGEVLRAVAAQTRATWEFLDHFHRELWALKQTTGALRFDEVTQALVDALGGGTLSADSLAFRLDGAVEHLLLDEFQDTSLAQWRVFEPIGRAIKDKPPRSFFCVGDVKQAIYAWRGGMSAIFDTLQNSLGPLPAETLIHSWRSAQPIIDTVNQVFENLTGFEGAAKCSDGLAAWRKRFDKHTTVIEKPGYASLECGPLQLLEDNLDAHRGKHCTYVAKEIEKLHLQTPNCSIGVLCRKNQTVGRMIYELRQRKIHASEEGGNPLTDSPAVLLVLSLLTLADHPGHSIASFHLENSPFKEHLKSFADADTLSRHLRLALLTDGYGPFVKSWQERLDASCDRRDRSRLQQLVEMAYDFQKRSTLRASDFVAWVASQRKPDPLAAKVRVMTIHGAKGLEFDIVVLPELDASLTGKTPKLVVGRDGNSLAANFVCRYVNEKVQKLLTPEQREAFARERQQRVEESLSLLYVAMTRAARALYMYIPGPRTLNCADAWYNLLLHTLAPQMPLKADTQMFESGAPQWFDEAEAKPASVGIPALTRPEHINFRAAAADRRRGLEHAAPSQREGGARVVLDRLFHPAPGTGTAAGTLYHAWFALINWLDEGEPKPEALRAAADKERQRLPLAIWSDRDRLLTKFTLFLQQPAVRAVLLRSAYCGPGQPGFPAQLAAIWTKSIAPRQVERERRFIVREGAKFWEGSLDRVVWLGDGQRTLAADIIDFKTDDLPPGNAAALAERTEHYRPQLVAYRGAVARLGQLRPECITARLVFTSVGKVVDV